MLLILGCIQNLIFKSNMKIKKGSNSLLFFAILMVVISCSDKKKALQFDLSKMKSSGVEVYSDYVGIPDSLGVFDAIELKLPHFEKGVYYSGGWWPTGANRVYGEIISNDSLNTVNEGGMFLLLKLSDDKYLSILPLADERAYTWFDTREDNLMLKVGTHGKESIEGDVPLFAWAFADNAYEACQLVWKETLDSEHLTGTTKLRYQKKYPEPFEYLGWCSWEQFHLNVTQENMSQVINQLNESEIPVRYFLLDDGHFNRQSIESNKNFPDGISALTKLKKEDRIKWMGIWYAYLGDNHGIKIPGDIGSVKKDMITSPANILLPTPGSKKSAENFFNYLLSPSKIEGFDFLKIDFQTDALTYYAGATHPEAIGGLPKNNSEAVDNPVKASVILAKEFHKAVENTGLDLMNCNWHQTVTLLYSGESVSGRCSEDYKVGNEAKAKAHLYHSYAAMPWLGQIAWGDHDMFHSNDAFAGRMMAVSKAISGGPVYLSDDPTAFLAENIDPLCFKDGRLLRPLAPAAPLPDDLFKSFEEKSLYKVVAPLSNNSAAIVVYNFGNEGQTYKSSITPDDYANATGMMQPYLGRWKVPSEGLFVYDWYKSTGTLMQDKFQVEIDGFGDKLYLISPVINGWSLVGRTDKYLASSAIEDIKYSKEQLSFVIIESGPITFYLDKGKPISENVFFVEKSKGVWVGDIIKGMKNLKIKIKRIL